MRFMFFVVNYFRHSNYPFSTPRKKDSENRIQLSEF